MINLPERFLDVMKPLLGEEFDTFVDSYEQGRQFGLRVNTARISTQEFERIAPFHLTRIPWIPNGYFYEEEDYPARHPFYAAGLYYLQEPSAMTPASRLPVYPGDKVLDTCAAPGGKATALGAKLKGKGLLVANDINAARGKALLRNIELFGFANTMVTNEAPYKLVDRFPEYFDKIMVDAPCSGEGMFRKNPAAIDNWLEKGPDYFSKLQFEIVQAAADMLKPGGMMYYSTCTFSPLENEGTIANLLKARPDMRVIPMADYEGFSKGFTGEELKVLADIYPELADVPKECGLTRRIWPHRMNGEGHFLALLQKLDENGELPEVSPEMPELLEEASLEMPGLLEEASLEMPEFAEAEVREGKKGKAAKGKKAEKKTREEKKGKEARLAKDTKGRKPAKGKHAKALSAGMTKEEKAAFDEFFAHVLKEIDEARIDVRGDKVYYLPEEIASPLMKESLRGIHFLRNGVYLGDLKKNRFEPSQPFALTLSKESFDQVIDLKQTDARLEAYQKGDTLDVSDLLEEAAKEGRKLSNGWYLVTVEGYAIGFGKLAGTTLKNKYPVGWRI